MPSPDPVDRPALGHGEGSTKPDLVELTRLANESGNGGDFDATISFFAPDSVVDMSPSGLGTYRGHAAIRGFFEDWIGSFDKFVVSPEEIVDLGTGVVFAVVRQRGRPAGAKRDLRLRYAAVYVWAEDKVARVTIYPNIDEGRAAAERLVQTR